MPRDPGWDLENQFRAALRPVVSGEARVLLAVSGGADSVAMLRLFAAIKPCEFEVATVDHGLRAKSAAEAKAVVEWASALGVKADVLTLDGDELRAGNLQARARDARYDALRTHASEHGFAHIAVAHTMDDQAETVLDRITRGASVVGLRALRSHGDILRPLLGVRRAALVAYLKQKGQPFVDDPSNDNRRFKRVRVRKLLAELSAEDPQLVRHLAELASDAAEVAAHLDAQLTFALDDTRELRRVDPAVRRHALKTLVQTRGISARRAHLLELEQLVETSRGEVLVGNGVRVRAHGNRLVFESGHAGRSQRATANVVEEEVEGAPDE